MITLPKTKTPFNNIGSSSPYWLINEPALKKSPYIAFRSINLLLSTNLLLYRPGSKYYLVEENQLLNFLTPQESEFLLW